MAFCNKICCQNLKRINKEIGENENCLKCNEIFRLLILISPNFVDKFFA